MKPIFQIHQCLSEENIKGYLTNRLSEEERFRVENHLLDCPLCSDAVDGYAAMEVDQSAGKGVGQQAVRLQMSNWRFFSAAAAILVLIAAAIWIFPKQPSTEKLFADYYTSYDSDLDIRFRQSGQTTNPADTPLTKGLRAYAQKDYAGSIPQLEAYLMENPNHLVSLFYLGLSKMEEGRDAEAIQQFDAVQKAGQEYSEESTWYLALLYVKNNRIDEAKSLLNTLIRPGSGRYYEKAKELYGRL